MKATIVSTDQLVEIDALAKPVETGNADRTKLQPTRRVLARAWEGLTENGVRFVAYVAIVQAATKDDNAEFERDLKADVHKKPDAWTQRAIDMRFFVD